MILFGKINDLRPYLLEKLFGQDKGKIYIKTPVFNRHTQKLLIEQVQYEEIFKYF